MANDPGARTVPLFPMYWGPTWEESSERRMPLNPGEWYEEKRLEAERLGHELAGARAVLDAIRNRAIGGRELMLDVAGEVVRRLERRLEQANYVGD